MLNTYSNNQIGGISPKNAAFISAIFLSIGAGLYAECDVAYKLFDGMMNEIRLAAKL